MAWQEGKTLSNGRYIINKKLGEGGFGITYLAKDTRNNNDVAIKTLNDDLRNRSDFMKLQEDFKKEAERLRRCTHPHIVKIHDLFLEENLFSIFSRFLGINPKLYIVMEYISEENLKNVISKRGALPEAEALKYIQQIGNALKIVHEQGLLHRDIKPENIMLRKDKSAVLIDFGIAREFLPDITLKHTVMCTPFYAPPEQFNSEAKRDAYTDIYALAATLYVLLVGRIPEGWTRLQPPKSLNPSISNQVNKAILKGMESKPEDRPKSVQEWLQMLPKEVRLTEPEVRPAEVNLWIWLPLYFVFWLIGSLVYTSILPISKEPYFGASSVEKGYNTLLLSAFLIAIVRPYSSRKKALISVLIISCFLGIISELITIFSNNFYDSWFIVLKHIILLCFACTLAFGVPSAIASSAKIGLRLHFNGFVIFLIVMAFSLLGIASNWLIHIWI